jgi:hypothetical protein
MLRHCYAVSFAALPVEPGGGFFHFLAASGRPCSRHREGLASVAPNARDAITSMLKISMDAGGMVSLRCEVSISRCS